MYKPRDYPGVEYSPRTISPLNPRIPAILTFVLEYALPVPQVLDSHWHNSHRPKTCRALHNLKINGLIWRKGLDPRSL